MPEGRRRGLILSALIGLVAFAIIWALPDNLRATKASAAVTAFGVVVAAVYAWFTHGLWNETAEQTRLALAQTRQTAAQTELDRDMFLAENRPYVAVRYDMPYVQNSSDLRTALSCRVILKNAGRTAAHVLLCSVDAIFRGQPIGHFDLGTAGMVLLPGEEQMIAGLWTFDGNPMDRYNQPDPMSLKARLEYMMDGSPGGPVHYVTASIIEVTQAGQFLTHQQLTSERITPAPGQTV